jgi:uncharacterized protein YbaP (TraB family)
MVLLSVTFSTHITFGQSEKVENSIFWKISGNGIQKPSYLFGTYHVLNNSFLDDIPNVKKIYLASHNIVVETELDSSKIGKVLFMAMMKDKKISNLISAEDYKLVSQELQSTSGMTMDMFNSFKPNFITVMITMAYNQKENKELLSKYSGQPIDGYLALYGRKNNKNVSTFETMQEQMDFLFNHDSDEKQAEQLVEFVKSKDEMIKSQVELTNMYLQQDLTGMYEMFKKYSKQFGDVDYLLDDRNVKWMEKIPGLLLTGDQFIAVGAMHFVGNNGLIKLLREKGYNVTPLSLK